MNHDALIDPLSRCRVCFIQNGIVDLNTHDIPRFCYKHKEFESIDQQFIRLQKRRTKEADEKWRIRTQKLNCIADIYGELLELEKLGLDVNATREIRVLVCSLELKIREETYQYEEE